MEKLMTIKDFMESKADADKITVMLYDLNCEDCNNDGIMWCGSYGELKAYSNGMENLTIHGYRTDMFCGKETFDIYIRL